MPGTKIRFDKEDYDFIMKYKESHSISIQAFVTLAIRELKARLIAEQQLKDLQYTENGTLHQR